MYYVYVLRSASTGKIYIGQTSHLENRLAQHNDPDCTFTMYTKRNQGPWVVIHTEMFPTRRQAMLREKQLKSGQGREWIRAHLLQEDGGC
ncbi:MAG: GIY-YIG nuclease family protein [Candidatus Hydrogenedentes bacterium]|nr:GIY-YIG nuclease family protein [Candidatus Hydrogenedentota bacterium]